MLRSLTIALAVPAVVCLAVGAPVPTHLLPNEEPCDFPTRVGARWVRQCDQDEERTEVITDVEEQSDGSKHVRVGNVNPAGRIVHVRTLAVSDRGVFLLAMGGHVFETTYCLLQRPHRVGGRWKNVKPSFWDRTCTAHGPEWVEVPAGRFRAVRVEMEEYRVPGKLARTTTWYAAGVGEVKSVSTAYGDESDFVTVLKSFSPGEK